MTVSALDTVTNIKKWDWLTGRIRCGIYGDGVQPYESLYYANLDVVEILDVFKFPSTDSVNCVENIIKCILNRWEILCGNLAATYPTLFCGI